MADDNAKLDACPHCGKGDAFVERSDYSACHVVCNECGARGPVRCDENEADAAAYENGDAEPGEMAARRAWNTRAAPPAMDREAVDFIRMVSRLTHSGDDGWTPDEADDATHALDGLIAKARTLVTDAPKASDASIWDSYRLPCDVHLAPVTIIRAGCQLSTLKVAMEVPHRPKHFEGHPNAALSTLSADAIRQGEGWQDMGSAPKHDGAKIIGYDAKWGVAEMMLDGAKRWVLAAFNGQVIYCNPLTWQPMPVTPASHASDGGK